MKCFLLALAFALCPDSLSAQTAAQPPLPTTTLRIGSQTVTAEIADEDHEREAGLMFRESLEENRGMLFVMPATGPTAFWMKNTSIPLDIAYIDPNGTIAEIHELEPFNEKPVRSTFSRIAYALEMRRGWFTKNNVWPGDRVTGLPKLPPSR